MKERKTPEIFLSYAKEDIAYYELFEKHFSESIREKRLALWSPAQVMPGTHVEEEIFAHLEQAALIVLLFSSDYLADDACYEQLQRAIQIGEQELERVFIILLRPCPWMPIWTRIEHKEHFRFLPQSYQALSHWPISNREDVAQEIVGDITRSLTRMQRGKRAGTQTRGPTTPLTPPEKMPNPYLALRSFGIEDEASFYGREAQTREILAKIEHMLSTRNTPEEQRLLAIIGASGAGKSSLLHAGVLPHLIRGELTGSEAWIILRTLYPGDQPLDNLADVLYDHLMLDEKREDVKGTLIGSASGLSYLIHQIVRHFQPQQTRHTSASTYVVLVIDQFEECLTQNTGEEGKKFIDLLFSAATRRDVPLLILMTCRADFYQELMGHENFFELLRQHEVILNKPMTFSEMRAAIEAPLHKLDSAFHFEQDLVDQIIADLQGQKEALPLLQFTLFELFERRQGFTLTRQAYTEISGVRGALAGHSEKIYESFQGQQLAVRKLFLGLVKVSMSEDQEFIAARQRVDYEQFLPPDKPNTSLERAQTVKMLNAFIDARLLTSNHQNNQRTLEISHEVLLQAWPRLARWVRENGEALYKKSRATQDARNWQRNGQPIRGLYTGQQLQELKDLVRQNLIANDEPLRTFLHESQVRQNLRRIVRVSIACVILLVLAPFVYNAFDYFVLSRNQIQVTSAADDGQGSLQNALRLAGPGDTIVLDAQTIGRSTLILHHDLNFTVSDVTLRDNGVIVTAPAGQQLHIFPGVKVSFENLSIKNSQSAPDRAQGGVIFNQGLLALNSCIIAENNANYNGGALVNTGYLTLDNTVFSHNSTTGYGGAIYNAGGSVFIGNNSRIEDNQARSGGGLYSLKGAVTIISSSIAGNTADQGDGSRYFGGGLALHNAALIMTDSKVEGNQVHGDGGGISLLDSSAILSTSSIVKNTAVITGSTASPAWGGGGIAVDTSVSKSSSSQALVVNTTISGNFIKIAPSIRSSANQQVITSDTFSDILGQQQRSQDIRSISAADPVTIGYPPPARGEPENLPNYIGTIDIDQFCQVHDYYQGGPTPDDLSSITCVSPYSSTPATPQTHKYPASEACKDLRNVDHATARLYDYYDPSTWECYKNVRQTPFVFTSQNMAGELDKFCQNTFGAGAGLSRSSPGKTAYDWECQTADAALVGISMADACRYITGNKLAFELLVRFNDPYGWTCWEPA